MKALFFPKEVCSRTDVLSKSTSLPKMRGVYSWFFTDELPHVLTSDCIKFNDLNLLCVGITPSRPGKNSAVSKETLYSRLRYHYIGNAYGSTLRLSLGCLLSGKLGIQLRHVGKSGKRMTFTKEGENIILMDGGECLRDMD